MWSVRLNWLLVFHLLPSAVYNWVPPGRLKGKITECVIVLGD